MGARAKELSQFLFATHCTDGNPVGKSFGYGHDIRIQLEVFKSKQFSCSTHSCLDFVDNQQSACFMRFFFNGFKPGGIPNDNAALSLNDFQNNGCLARQLESRLVCFRAGIAKACNHAVSFAKFFSNAFLQAAFIKV